MYFYVQCHILVFWIFFFTIYVFFLLYTEIFIYISFFLTWSQGKFRIGPEECYMHINDALFNKLEKYENSKLDHSISYLFGAKISLCKFEPLYIYSWIKKLHPTLLTAWGTMMGSPGRGLLALAGSIPTPVNSNPTLPELISVISAVATWSYIYKAIQNK